MGFLEILIIGIGLSMDAFAVSICKGLSTRKLQLKHALICGGYFGFFQGFMPLLGYLLGIQFKDKIESIDHWEESEAGYESHQDVCECDSTDSAQYQRKYGEAEI